MNMRSFFDFPAEIRNQIYEYLLAPTQLIVIEYNGRLLSEKVIGTVGYGETDNVEDDWVLCPQILATCHQAYAEASSLLYIKNCFL